VTGLSYRTERHNENNENNENNERGKRREREGERERVHKSICKHFRGAPNYKRGPKEE